jgi:hypothetical protein
MASKPAPGKKTVFALVAALGVLLSCVVLVGIQPWAARESEVVVSCYSLPDMSETEPFESVTVTRPEGDPLSARQAIKLCAALWSEGVVASQSGDVDFLSGGVDFQSSGGVPLTACVTPEGDIAVLPGVNLICDDLGFHPIEKELP